MDAAIAFARNAVKTRYEDIPVDAVKGARADILDTADAIRDPGVVALANKVTPVLDCSLGGREPAASALEVKTRRGSFYRRVDLPYGYPQQPMSAEAMAQKFRDCATYAARPLPADDVDGLIGLFDRLESIASMHDLFRLLQ